MKGGRIGTMSDADLRALAEAVAARASNGLDGNHSGMGNRVRVVMQHALRGDIYIDGVLIEGVASFKFEASNDTFNEVTLTFSPSTVELDVEATVSSPTATGDA